MNNTKIINLGNNIDRGFFSYIYTTFSSIYICDLKNIPFYIDWKSDKNYKNIESDNPFDYYFKQPFFENSPENANYFSEQGLFLYTDIDLKNRETWNYLLKKYLILKNDIKNEIDEYYKNNFLNKKILCVHKRGTDHTFHKPIQENIEYFNVIDEELSKNHYDKIFLATDENKSIIEFKDKYKDKLIFLNNIRSDNNSAIFKLNIDKNQHCKEAIMDAFLLSKGNKLIKTKSTLTTIVCYLNKDLEYISIDNHLKFK